VQTRPDRHAPSTRSKTAELGSIFHTLTSRIMVQSITMNTEKGMERLFEVPDHLPNGQY
jgi:hypothetical protein